MKYSCKWVFLLLAIVMVLTATAAQAIMVEPEDSGIGRLSGATVSATVGAYNEFAQTFTVTLYENDRFKAEDIKALAPGDLILAGGALYKMTGTEKLDDDTVYLFEGGEEIYFVPADDGTILAQSTFDDRRFMHAYAILQLPFTENLVLEDASDPESMDPVVTAGLENILKVKSEMEETSNGLNYYATKITLNGNLEIVSIHRDYDVAQ
ncbi:MAG: hypothetical protein K5746_02385 [Clostridiales bacterium]|nr:hypothetical protein [Clostridiales bacterium]